MDPESVGARALCPNASTNGRTWIVNLEATSRIKDLDHCAMKIWAVKNVRENRYRPDFITNAFFVVNDKENAERIARAFRHFIKLAGGKVAPF